MAVFDDVALTANVTGRLTSKSYNIGRHARIIPLGLTGINRVMEGSLAL